jgi:hypothetical protein
MSFRISIVPAALYLVFVSNAVFAEDVFNYAIAVNDEELGTLSIEHQDKDDGHYVIAQHTHIKSSGYFEDFVYQGALKESHSPTGLLLESSNKENINNETYWTQIELSGDEYLAFSSQLKNDQEKEDDDAIGLAQGALSYIVPGAGDAMTVGEALISDDKQEKRNNRFPKESFDVSFLNLPYLWKKNNLSLPSPLRIIDTEEMHIFQASILPRGKEEVKINGRVLEAYHYSLVVEDSEPTEIWLALNKTQIPFFVRIKGNDDEGPYEIEYRPNLAN